MGEAGIGAILHRIGVNSGLHGPEIVARGKHYGVDPVHDPLVVGNSPVRLYFSDSDGPDELFREDLS